MPSVVHVNSDSTNEIDLTCVYPPSACTQFNPTQLHAPTVCVCVHPFVCVVKLDSRHSNKLLYSTWPTLYFPFNSTNSLPRSNGVLYCTSIHCSCWLSSLARVCITRLHSTRLTLAYIYPLLPLFKLEYSSTYTSHSTFDLTLRTLFLLSVSTSNRTPQQSPITQGPFTTNSRSPFRLRMLSLGVQQPPQHDCVTLPMTCPSSLGPWKTVTFSRQGSHHAHGNSRKCRWNARTYTVTRHEKTYMFIHKGIYYGVCIAQ